MSIPSNLYAEKVFGEHPLALWPLDEDIDYIQFLSLENRDISDPSVWTVSRCSVSSYTSLSSPIENESVSRILSSSNSSYEIKSNNLIVDYPNEELDSISFGFYFYADSTNIDYLEIGYSENGIKEIERVSVTEYDKWKYISVTLPMQEKTLLNGQIFSIVSDDLDIFSGEATLINYESHGLSNGDRLKISSSYIMPDGLKEYHVYRVVLPDGEYDDPENSFYIEEEFGSGAIRFSFSEYGNLFFKKIKPLTPIIEVYLSDIANSTAYISAPSFGQWSSEFSEYSMGVVPQHINGIAIEDELDGLSVPTYGLQDLDGYFLSRENKLLAKNTSMPMVFGSKNLTSILPERFGSPSIIIPGKGFLNEEGRYKTYTVEMWLRIDPKTIVPKRIFGPISSTDGLYVDGPFLTLKINGNIQSHYVGEWYRPMLVNILVFRNGASLIINGEKVFDLNFDSSQLSLPSAFSLSGKEQDWLGFYSYSDIDKFEIDCPAIYSYRVPSVIAKRRWVYGQGIDFPENISNSYSGKSFPVDYTFADYSNNYIYPDTARWQQGSGENVSFDNNVLQPPKYTLPRFVFNNSKTESAWYNSLKNNTFNGIALKPDESWSDTDGYLFFRDSNALEQKTIGFYGVFEPRLDFNSTETLFRLENPVNGNYLTVDLHTETLAVDSFSGTSIAVDDHGLLDDDIVKFSDSVTGPTIVSEIATAVSPGSSTNIATITTSTTAHDLCPGHGVVLNDFEASNPSSPAINGTYLVVSVLSENTFTISFSTSIQESVSFSGGTVTHLGIVKDKEYFVTKINKNSFSIRSSKEDQCEILISEIVEYDDVDVIFYSIRYKMKFGSSPETLVYKTPAVTLGNSIVAGINFSKFANHFGGNVATLIGNRRQLSLYVGGTKDFANTFSGYIYRIGFCTERNISKLNYLFSTNGTPFLRYQFDGGTDVSLDADDWDGETIDAGYAYEDYIDDILGHVASYTLLVKSFFGERYLDIATNSYWQDYVPFSYFNKNIIDQDGDGIYRTDFLQYDSDTNLLESFDYDEYADEPWTYNTDSSLIKTYISFQYVSSGPTVTEENLITVLLGRDRVINPGTGWIGNKYEIVSGTIVYPPANVNLDDLAVVIHADISSNGIIKNPIRVKSIALASKSLNYLLPNPIKARFGAQMIPYNKYGFYYDYRAKNPYIIYKDSTPHLYLTKHSGIELTGNFDNERGISIPVNRQQRSSYDLSTVTFSMRFSRSDIVSEPVEILQIEDSSSDQVLKMWIEPSLPSDQRFKLFVTNKDGESLSDVDIYINGNLITNTVITIRDWNMISVALKNPINLDGISGRINFVGPILFNNVSYFALNALQKAKEQVSQEEEYFGVDPGTIYDIFVGTNKITAGDNLSIYPEKYRYSVLNDLSLQSSTIKPV